MLCDVSAWACLLVGFCLATGEVVAEPGKHSHEHEHALVLGPKPRPEPRVTRRALVQAAVRDAASATRLQPESTQRPVSAPAEPLFAEKGLTGPLRGKTLRNA